MLRCQISCYRCHVPSSPLFTLYNYFRHFTGSWLIYDDQVLPQGYETPNPSPGKVGIYEDVYCESPSCGKTRERGEGMTRRRLLLSRNRTRDWTLRLFSLRLFEFLPLPVYVCLSMHGCPYVSLSVSLSVSVCFSVFLSHSVQTRVLCGRPKPMSASSFIVIVIVIRCNNRFHDQSLNHNGS